MDQVRHAFASLHPVDEHRNPVCTPGIKAMKKERRSKRILAAHPPFGIKQVLVVALLCLSVTGAWAQSAQAPGSGTTSRTITAIGYPVGGGTIKINLKGTGMIASASGQAKVEAKSGITQVELAVKGLTPPTPI